MSEKHQISCPKRGRLSRQYSPAALCGYTARNRADVEAHIKELTAIGIGAPPQSECSFQLAGSLPALLSQSSRCAGTARGSHVRGDVRVEVASRARHAGHGRGRDGWREPVTGLGRFRK